MNSRIVAAILLSLLCLTTCSHSPRHSSTMDAGNDHSSTNSDQKWTSENVRTELEKSCEILKNHDPQKIAAVQSTMKRIVAQQPELLIQQIILFSATKSSNPPSSPAYINTMATFFHIAELDKNKPLLAYAVVPLLLDKNPKVISLVRMVQSTAESESQESDFSVYKTYLSSNSEKLSASSIALIQYMAEKDPSQAIEVCAVAFGPKIGKEKRNNILMSTRCIDDLLWRKKYGLKNDQKKIESLQSELEKILQANEWWANLGVAELLSQHPELQTPTLTQTLAADQNEYVKSALQKGNK